MPDRSLKSGCLLHVEDDEDDVLFLSLAAEEVGMPTPIEVVRDGQEAINFLSAALRGVESGKGTLPSLVLLDLKLPVVMGLEVLRQFREQPEMRKLPVMILSASDHPLDLEQARELGADAYFIKPCSLAERTA